VARRENHVELGQIVGVASHALQVGNIAFAIG
jgi:hypothetical protein